MLVDAHVHLLPDRLARAIRRFFVARMPDYGGCPCELAPARAAVAAAGVTRCWSLPYAHKPGMARDLNRWMAETFADDAMVIAGATVHPGDDVAREVGEALDVLGLRIVKLHCGMPATSAALDLLRRAPSLYADLTPVGPMLAQVSREAIAGLEDRLLFGSDAPNTGVPIEKAVAHVRALGLDGAAESAVLGATAERLLAA